MKMSQAEFEAQLAEIRKAYIASLKDKRETIINNWAELCMQWNMKTYESLYLVIHGLAGSAQTFDLDNITQDARNVIQIFKQQASHESLSAVNISPIQASIEKLVDEINQVLAREQI